MTLEALYAFQKVARLGHLTEAAEQLNMSQPALSRVIHSLEQEIAAPLFDRIGNRIILNANGKMFLETVDSILLQYDQTLSRIQESNHILNHSIRLCITSAGIYVPEIIRGFKNRHPDTLFYISSGPGESDQSCHFSLRCAATVKLPESSVLLAKEKLYLTASLDSPLVGLSSVRLRDLKKYNFLFSSDTNDMHDIQLYYCRQAGFDPEIRVTSEKMNIIESLVQIGEGVALFPKFSDFQNIHKGFVQIPISDMDCSRYIYLQDTKKVYQTALASDFKRYCISFFRQIDTVSLS
ncbi:MAG: LysR family transcriptional regulator [Lachnospiraceae bacterium]